MNTLAPCLSRLFAALLIATFWFSPVYAVCGDGSLEGGEECDPGGGLYLNGDPANPTCTTGGECFYEYNCCKFNCQYVGEGPTCNDNDACTVDDQCDQVGNCLGQGSSPDQTVCDDGIFCNGADRCVNGVCSQHDGDPCPGTECNTCQEETDTCFDPAATPCANNDGNDCTTGTCDGNGSCGVTAVEGPCDDGVFCNGTDTCDAGTCSQHSGDPCPGTECNTCQEDVDSCFDPDTTACTDDGNACTDDLCDGSGSCNPTNNSLPCDDGLYCNGTDTCSGGGCSGHTGDPCVDAVSCTVDVCDEGSDACSNTPDDAACDDTLYCNGVETCDALLDCQAGVDPCDDGESCTDDTCDEGTDSCSYDPLLENAVCDDGDVCTIDDQCVGGICSGSDPQIVDLCPWTLIIREEAKENKIKTGLLSNVGGDICAAKLMIGAQSVNASDVVAVATDGKKGLAFGSEAVVVDDIVSGGAGAKGKPRTVKLPYTDVSKLDPGTLTAKNDASGDYDLTGTHALVTECEQARGAYDSFALYVEGLGATQDLGKYKLGREETLTITATPPGGVTVVDFLKLRASKSSVIELDGGGDADSVIVLRISGKLDLKLLTQVSLINGMQTGNVLIYSSGKVCKIGDKVTGAGTVMCSVGKIKVGKSSTWDGMLLAGRKLMKFGDGSTVTYQPFVAF